MKITTMKIKVTTTPKLARPKQQTTQDFCSISDGIAARIKEKDGKRREQAGQGEVGYS